MLKTTRWSPDTCACVVEYQWETDAPSETRDHTFSAVVSRCAAHAALDDLGVWAAVKEENPRKNVVVNEIADQFGVARETLVWRFVDAEGYRLLEVTLPRDAPATLTAMQAAADATVGAGKVRILPSS